MADDLPVEPIVEAPATPPAAVHCPACHHDFAPLSAIGTLVICPKCFRTLVLRDCCASPASGADLESVDSDDIAALKKQRNAMRKAARA